MAKLWQNYGKNNISMVIIWMWSLSIIWIPEFWKAISHLLKNRTLLSGLWSQLSVAHWPAVLSTVPADLHALAHPPADTPPDNPGDFFFQHAMPSIWSNNRDMLIITNLVLGDKNTFISYAVYTSHLVCTIMTSWLAHLHFDLPMTPPLEPSWVPVAASPVAPVSRTRNNSGAPHQSPWPAELTELMGIPAGPMWQQTATKMKFHGCGYEPNQLQ